MRAPRNVVELLSDLVAIPSVNPHGQPGTDRVGEQAIAEYVAGFLAGLGAEVRLEPVEPGRPNVRAVFSPSGPPAARLAFAPHLDTVSVAGMTVAPFDPTIRDGKLFGRGASDTKGPMAAALWALREWAQGNARAASRIEWTFLALMGEEAGNDGAYAVARAGLSSDLVVVLEPTELRVVTAHKGALWLEVITPGVACHGATPEQGQNAIDAMRRVLEIVEEETRPALARQTHPKLGATTLNVGTIAGGSKINIVPDQCRIEVDLRYIPGWPLDGFPAEWQARFQAVAPGTIVRLLRNSTPLDTDEAQPWVAHLGSAAQGFTTAPWFSDASIFSAAGLPAVCLGPGSIAQAHTRDEFIRLVDLQEGAARFRRWIERAEEEVA